MFTYLFDCVSMEAQMYIFPYVLKFDTLTFASPTLFMREDQKNSHQGRVLGVKDINGGNVKDW